MVAGLAAAATIALILGDSGIVAYRRAAEYRDRLVGGIEEIEAAHRRLQRQLARFQSDAEAVRLAARELGYYRPDETVVSITEGRGRSAVAERDDAFDATYYTVGPLVMDPMPRSHGSAKTLPMGFSFGALLFVVVAAAEAIRGRGNAEEETRPRQRRERATERTRQRRRAVRGERRPPKHKRDGSWASAADPDARGAEMHPITGQVIEREWVARADVGSRPVPRRSGHFAPSERLPSAEPIASS